MSKLSAWRNREKQSGIPVRSYAPQMSAGQKGIFLQSRISQHPLLYQYGHIYRFQEPLDHKELSIRFNAFIDRHEVMRSNYLLSNQDPSVVIHEKKTIEIQESKTIDPQFFLTPFDLERDLLIKAAIIDQKTLALSIHHIIGDRQSLDVLLSELLTHENLQKPLDTSYFDFSEWNSNRLNSEENTNYWKRRLSGHLPILDLPLDFARATALSNNGAHISLHTETEVLSEIKKFSKEQSCSHSVILSAAFYVFLHLYTGQNDIIIGSPVSNRDHSSLNRLFGYFNETLIQRCSIDTSDTFAQLVDKVNSNFLNDLTHKDVSIDHLIKEINPPRFSGINPLFQAMLVYNKASDHQSAGIISSEMVDLGVSKFDLTLFVEEDSDKFVLKLEYLSSLFKPETAERMLADFRGVLSQLVAAPQNEISHCEIPSALALPRPEYRILETDHENILDAINFDSEKIAVCFESETLTYKSLDQKSSLVAQRLQREGVNPSDFVGLHCSRSLEMIVGILGILKAGAAYVPLDPAYPADRLKFMVENSDLDLILCKEMSDLADVKLISISEVLSTETKTVFSKTSHCDYAYMIYTSGSSGKPKGVPITHRNLLVSTLSRFDFYKDPVTAFLLLSSFSFDSSVAGIFWTLCSGGKLVLPKERTEQDIATLSTLIEREAVSHSLMLPSLYTILLSYASPTKLRSLRNIMVAGEACQSSTVKAHFAKLPHCKIYNEYGPTEGTVWSVAHEIKVSDTDGTIPIGQAIPYYQAFILNPSGQELPVGAKGELYIAGEGIMNGYWKKDELTRERIVNHPTKGRLYKTGDLAKWDKDGRIYFLGRNDNQVKILGHRIELDEIKNKIIKNFQDIEELEVLVDKGKIRVYYTGVKDIPAEFNVNLPSFMQPSSYIKVADFPRLPNGKLDKTELLQIVVEPENKKVSNHVMSVEEEILHDIWKDLLSLDTLSVSDNFFELGGNSLISIHMLSRAKDRGLEITSSQLFEFQTIQQLAASLKNKENSENKLLVSFRNEGHETPLFCIHGGGGHVFFYKNFAEELPESLPVYSFQPEGLDGKNEMAGSIEEMASTYIAEMKSVQSKGPYRILGTCFSNAVALEMAHQLHHEGENIDALFIIDSAPVHLFGNTKASGKQTMRRFFDMIKRGDFQRIKAKVKSRFFGQKEWKGEIKAAVETDDNLAETISRMNHMYANYDWHPYHGEISFIRSTEFNERADKNYHLQQWRKLAKGGLQVSVVEGHHVTLFEKPEVKGLAYKVSELLQLS